MSALLIEYLRRDGSAMQVADLSLEYLAQIKVPLAQANRPLRIEAEPKRSERGNTYFEYTQAGIPLVDGLQTQLRVGGVDLKFGDERVSKAGNPTRDAKTVIDIEGTPYEVTAFITQTRQNYWVKVHAHKKSGRAPAGPNSPIVGGRIV